MNHKEVPLGSAFDSDLKQKFIRIQKLESLIINIRKERGTLLKKLHTAEKEKHELIMTAELK
jgi:hypothetical protein